MGATALGPCERACMPARSAISPPPSRTLRTRASAIPSPLRDHPAAEPLPGYRKVNAHGVLRHLSGRRRAISAICATRWKSCSSTTLRSTFEPETSVALGFGFRCGFLGLLHMEIIQERLEREFNLDLITTAPSVIYQITMTDGERDARSTTRPTIPTRADIELAEEPIVKAQHIIYADRLCRQHHGALPGAARHLQGYEVSGRRPAWSFITNCRSTRSSTTFSTRSNPAPRDMPPSTMS